MCRILPSNGLTLTHTLCVIDTPAAGVAEGGKEAEDARSAEPIPILDSSKVGGGKKGKGGILGAVKSWSSSMVDARKQMDAIQRFSADFPYLISYLLCIFCALSFVELLIRAFHQL